MNDEPTPMSPPEMARFHAEQGEHAAREYQKVEYHAKASRDAWRSIGEAARDVRDSAARGSGALREGDQVMSTTQYATSFRINPATAAKAFGELVDEEVLHKQRGRGMFVSEGAPERLRAARREAFFADRLDPTLREARLLGITHDQLIAHITGHEKGTS